MTHSGDNANNQHQGFILGEWLVLPETGVLVRGDHHVHAEPKVMQVLECLIMAQGRVVSREELINQVWPRVVVNDEVLTRAISELRSLLGDVSRERRYIVTIPKRGYRLIMPATAVTEPSASHTHHNQNHRPAAINKSRGFTGAVLAARHWLARPAAYTATALPLLLVSLWLGSTYTGGPANETVVRPTIDHPSASLARSSTLPHTVTETLNAELKYLKAVDVLRTPMEDLNGFGGRTVLMTPLLAITDDELTRAFAAGLTQDLQHSVYQQTSLQVVQPVDGVLLDTALIFSGSVRIYDQIARISLQLIDAQNSSLLWSSSFECSLDDTLGLQSRIARQVGRELQRSGTNYV